MFPHRWITPFLFTFLLLAGVGHAALPQEKIAAYPILPAGTSSIRVFDRQERFVGRILPSERYWVPLNRIPLFLRQAIVAVEDSRFYEHGGVDIRGIARALVKDVVKRRMAEGGSTITQQLIKNKYLSGEKTLDRKINEVRLAIDFEKKYTKDQILEMYLNTINYGNGAWGIAQAARLYFDKNPEELTDAECSLLAGVPKAPGRYNPLGDPAKVALRRSVVLKRMVDVNFISPQQKANLMAHRVQVMKSGEAPYYLAYIKGKLVERLGPKIIEQGGLDVITGMDLNLQLLAEKALRDGVRKISPKLQGALICLDPATGDVLAAVGGVDFTQSSYNRAFVAKRQPGSSIKPLIYAAALEKGITAGSIWNDSPVDYNGWRPMNYERKLYGDLSLRQALAHSNNVVTVKVLENIGVPYFTEFAQKMGLPLRNSNDLSLALGTEEVTLNDLVGAYAPLANGGSRLESRAIIRIFEKGHGTWTQIPTAAAPALTPAAAYVTTQMLKDVLIYGTAKSLKRFSQERPAAGKTGTTNDYRDAWFIGYTPQMVTGVWVGYDKPRPGGKGFTGGAISAPIWGTFMRSALLGKPAADFARPETVVSATIDPTTGYLATPQCPTKKEEFYVAGTQPTQFCPKHGGGAFKPISSAQSPLAPVNPPVFGGHTSQ